MARPAESTGTEAGATRDRASGFLNAGALIVAGALLVAFRAAGPTPDGLADWTRCMADRTPPPIAVRACASALRAAPLSRFHRSLLRARRGEALMLLGRPARAIGEFDRAFADAPGDETILADRGEAHMRLRRLAAAEQDYGAAIARHVAVPANRDNGSSDILACYLAERGRIRLRRGHAAGAAQDFARALAIDPAGATPQLRLLLDAAVARSR